MHSIRHQAARTAQQAGLITGGMLICAVGVGFLTLSAWLLLVSLTDPAYAALIIAGTYLGVGAILVGLSGRSGSPNMAHSSAQGDQQVSSLVEAFLYGLNAGRQATKSRR